MECQVLTGMKILNVTLLVLWRKRLCNNSKMNWGKLYRGSLCFPKINRLWSVPAATPNNPKLGPLSSLARAGLCPALRGNPNTVPDKVIKSCPNPISSSAPPSVTCSPAASTYSPHLPLALAHLWAQMFLWVSPCVRKPLWKIARIKRSICDSTALLEIEWNFENQQLTCTSTWNKLIKITHRLN